MEFVKQMEVLYNAVKTFGLSSQLAMLQEECCECGAAINHYHRGKISSEDLISEMVDVEIMIDQMKLIYPSSIWNKEKDFKLNRLKQTIEKFKEKTDATI